jgi:AcrR family transcriptional regulator
VARVYSSVRNALLDAAERVLLRGGLGSLSVQAVVAEAGVSKGAFFHHFPTRDALLGALVDRLSEQVFSEVATATTRTGRAPLRARIDLTFDMPVEGRRRLRALILAVIEAVQSRPAVAKNAVRANARELRQALQGGISEGAALAVQLALDGLWLGEALGTVSLTPRQRSAVRRALLRMAS